MHNKYVSEFSPPPMVNFSNDDIEEFAKWLGFDGSDVDTFYEAYYDIDYYDDQEVEAATELGNDSQSVFRALPLSLCDCGTIDSTANQLSYPSV